MYGACRIAIKMHTTINLTSAGWVQEVAWDIRFSHDCFEPLVVASGSGSTVILRISLRTRYSSLDAIVFLVQSKTRVNLHSSR